MTDSMVSVARAALPGADVQGWTNASGPPAIQGPEDGAAAVGGLLALLPEARNAGVQAIVIGCFDDTGLARLRHAAHCPVLGLGQAAMALAALYGRFGVVTTLDVSVPVIEANVQAYGHAGACVGVLASGLAVLEVEAGGPAVERRLAARIAEAQTAGAGAVVLGCAGMARLRPGLSTRSGPVLVDGVTASAHLARALVAPPGQGLGRPDHKATVSTEDAPAAGV